MHYNESSEHAFRVSFISAFEATKNKTNDNKNSSDRKFIMARKPLIQNFNLSRN